MSCIPRFHRSAGLGGSLVPCCIVVFLVPCCIPAVSHCHEGQTIPSHPTRHQPCRLFFGAVPDRNALGQEAGAQLRCGTAQISSHSATASSSLSPSKPQLGAVRDPTEENEGKGKAQMNHLHLVGMTPQKCPWHRSRSR